MDVSNNNLLIRRNRYPINGKSYMNRFQQPIFEGMLIILLGIIGIFRVLEGLRDAVYWNKIMLYMLFMIFIGITGIGVKVLVGGISKK